MSVAALGRALILRFPQPLDVRVARSGAARMLLAFACWALLLQPGLKLIVAAAGAGPGPRVGLLLSLLTAAAFLQLSWMGLSSAAMGWKPWSRWSSEERLFLLQALMTLALVLTLSGPSLSPAMRSQGLFGLVLAVATGFVWGLLQEWVYRGWLQTALQTRLGPWAALLLANLLFTFGPLHGALYRWGSPEPVAFATFAAIFAIGLLFGWLYQRSGNLWLPAILHGAWPLNM
ncbi:CPBP family intramembrane glutamic endopeptidase [Pseudomarimonas arenosa]|uniref:CPBP family intramembrane metalloprotease n=1 Tax=Pseudomarimonas arenosa TaxID=2774145 RepID=A0AAW3ZMR9_9GAMM|nr:CPBP family intramembrane glutamic endopeptidase [Pseudomarimonas arenosa]MBD8525606.1 CPBP family intramembrane metalloprotease [Pseudomarimonas arenosa]